VAARLVAVPLLGGPLVMGLAACASPLPAERLADAVADALESRLGFRPEVTCPEDVEAEVGAQGRCTATAEGDSVGYAATVTVTSVTGDEAEFDVRVERQPRG
jgi:hypothetical protein